MSASHARNKKRIQNSETINSENDPSINNPDDSESTGKSDLEGDLALLEDEDMGW